MGEIGRYALLAAAIVALYGLVVSVLGLRWRHGGLLESARRAVTVWALLIALASAALFAAFLGRDFSVRFVAGASETTQSLFYTVAAFWGGHDGALLLWALILAGYMVAGVRGLRDYPDLQGPAVATLFVIAAFFSLLLASASNPFVPLIPPPPDGQGLNPLLRNPWMAAHPPTLYLGFVGMSVPFALVVAALVTGRLDDTWILLSRRWVILAWLFLTLGLLFGAKWSYVVLGWGGYWAWDPVENAAFMPWLTATAWLHSIQIQERRGMLATWNVALLLITFGLTIFGTFLVRSGVLSSIHAFAQSPIGYFFLAFLAVLLVGSFALLAWRWDLLHSRGTVESVISRETAFLANNLLFVSAAVVVFLGTIFPAITEATSGVKINVGPGYFNMVMVPIAVGILLLMGIGPLLPWRKATPEQLARNFTWPAAAAVLVAAGLAAGGVRSTGALLVFALVVFVGATIALEAARGTAVRTRRGEPLPVAVWRLLARNRRRYGGYTVHLGILLMLVGIAGSSAFATQSQALLRPGERFTAGRYTLEFIGLSGREEPGIDITTATVRVWAGARFLGTVRPERLFYRTQEQPMHHVTIRSSPREDLYVILSEWEPDGRAMIRVLIHPLVLWLWAGGFVIALGVVLAVLPETWRRPVPHPATAARGLPLSAQGTSGAP
ncbi:MAG: cytochrome c-type biogenesis CcmF C-terminal domain-containing protein [Armatimonadota bacterium]|nr:cytochrome c-type biogenesis CcmF C-terminal domain-containing protein [Armatimonadota bacterium]MDR7422794.1 cytochrome c-type biogenesis CcmF C-terminal domain-containing protein [Armatimonadota bacterium]MDR7453346.1 cytochrome c-type biogenesis CcmF C-terminal domain-containing protein [Armatimonadota bacterium]MDR7457032.1 cytochrome c-type biogenesis CcmF C-terminal domain-containing protein [Armatimonadota bacterium]MDR7497214.1 cytochrome c-type biogenesis CcmF C-terminal domain-cont